MAERSASISTMAVTTKGILSPRSADLKLLDTTNICSYNVIVKMGVGGMSAATRALGQGLVARADEYIRQYEGQGLGESVEREVERLRRARGQLELQLWQTSPLFCRGR